MTFFRDMDLPEPVLSASPRMSINTFEIEGFWKPYFINILIYGNDHIVSSQFIADGIISHMKTFFNKKRFHSMSIRIYKLNCNTNFLQEILFRHFNVFPIITLDYNYENA